MTRRNRALIYGIVSGLAEAGYLATRQYLWQTRLPEAYQWIGQSRCEWLILMGSSAVSSMGTPAPLRRARVRIVGPMLVVAALLLLFVSVLPLYWYVYRDVEPGWHIYVPEGQRYCAPLAGMTAAAVDGILPRTDRTRARHSAA